MSEELKPCAYCGQLPMEQRENRFFHPLGKHEKCPGAFHYDFPRAENWNEHQELALAQRRKDFEAGVYFAKHIYWRTGPPDWGKVAAQERSYFVDLEKEEYTEVDAFNDYIKEQGK